MLGCVRQPEIIRVPRMRVTSWNVNKYILRRNDMALICSVYLETHSSCSCRTVTTRVNKIQKNRLGIGWNKD